MEALGLGGGYSFAGGVYGGALGTEVAVPVGIVWLWIVEVVDIDVPDAARWTFRPPEHPCVQVDTYCQISFQGVHRPRPV